MREETNEALQRLDHLREGHQSWSLRRARVGLRERVAEPLDQNERRCEMARGGDAEPLGEKRASMNAELEELLPIQLRQLTFERGDTPAYVAQRRAL